MNNRLHRFAVIVAISTFLLIFAGGLVTSTGSGLSVPDWPLSFGRFFPKMEGGVAYEHGHRMAAGIVGLLTIVLAVWLRLSEPRRWLRSLGILAIAAVIGQAVLGGMTVLFRLPPALSVGHAALAQAFFCITFAIALATSSRWELKSSRVNCVRAQSAKLFGIAVMGLIVVQLLLGAVMRHTGSGLAIPDFPLSYGHIIPPFFTSQIIYNFTHRAMALVVICFAAWFSVKALRLNPTPLFVRFPSILLLALLIIQLSLGAETVWSHKAPLPTTLHVACGALILGTCLWLTMNIYKAAKPGSPADLHLTSSIGQKVR